MISNIVNLLKGESSFWINKSRLLDQGIKEKFEWQDDYWVESISPADLYRLIHYIQNQEIHHMKVNFKEEVERVFNCHGLKARDNK